MQGRKMKRRERVIEDDDEEEEVECSPEDEGYGSDSIVPRGVDEKWYELRERPKSSRCIDFDLKSASKIEELLEELRTHFCPSYRLNGLRKSLNTEMRRRDIGIGDMFALVDTDGSWSIDATELCSMAKELGIDVRRADAESLISEIGGGTKELSVERFVFWFNDTTDTQMNLEFSHGTLLALDSCLKEDEVALLVSEFWKLADADGSGELQRDEYIELSVNLQRALLAEDERRSEYRLIKNAEQDWDEDRRGHNYVDHRRFSLSLLQLADAWSESDDFLFTPNVAATAKLVAETLAILLEKVSVLIDNTDHDTTSSDLDSFRSPPRRIWRWKLPPEVPEEDETFDDETTTFVFEEEVVEEEEAAEEEEEEEVVQEEPKPEPVVEDVIVEEEEEEFEEEISVEEPPPPAPAPPPPVEPPPVVEVEAPPPKVIEKPKPQPEMIIIPEPPPSPHAKERALLDTLQPLPSQPTLKEAWPLLSYRTSLQSPVTEPMPRLVPRRTPVQQLSEANDFARLSEATIVISDKELTRTVCVPAGTMKPPLVTKKAPAAIIPPYGIKFNRDLFSDSFFLKLQSPVHTKQRKPFVFCTSPKPLLREPEASSFLPDIVVAPTPVVVKRVKSTKKSRGFSNLKSQQHEKFLASAAFCSSSPAVSLLPT